MVVQVYQNADIAGKAAATLFAAQVISKPDSVLGFATGSTPLPTYRYIIESYRSGLVDYSRVTTFNLDEYCGLSGDHPQSYRKFMMDNLFSGLNVPAERIHVPKGDTGDDETECWNYEKNIAAAGGVDLQILGIGHNGHIGFNEPGTEFTQYTHKVALTESTIQANKRFFENEDQVPRFALTMGIGTIMRARKIVMVVTGSDKAGAVHDMLRGPVHPDCPASILQLHEDATVLLDKDAASLLD